MSNPAVEDVGIPLSQASKFLERELGGKAPSYVTLRRWAENGRLGAAQVPSRRGVRQLYDPKKLLAIFTSRALVASAGKGKASDPEDLKPFGRRMDEVEATLASLVEMQKQTQALLSAVATEVRRLDGVRTTLMLKYDAEHATNRQTIDELRARLKETAAPDNDRTLNKVLIALSQMRDTLNDVVNRPCP